MKNVLSRWHPRYLRSLVYMLQASEYHPREYLAWVARTSNFRRVEKRKSLVKTAKARALLLSLWVLTVLTLLAIAASGFSGTTANHIVVLALLVLYPIALPYLLLCVLALVTLVQWPFERRALARARQKLAQHQAFKIGIAGSFGKTSMREILKTVLAEGKKVAAPTSSVNTPLGIARFAESLSGDEDVLLFELGEYYPGDVRKLCELVGPSLGVITGVNEAHLEKFKDLARTADTVFELADCLEGKPVYVNGESALAKKRAGDSHILYGSEGAGEWQVTMARSDLGGTTVGLADAHGVTIRATSKLLGLHHVGALAAAADIAKRLGLTQEEIQRGIEKTAPFEHRLEPKQMGDGVVLLDDSYNGNPDGVRSVIAFLASLKGHRRIYVTPGLVEMGERAEAVHRAIGKQLAEAGIEVVVLVKNSVTPFIEAGLKEVGYTGDVKWYDDGPAALTALPTMTVSGDVVVLQNDWPDQYV